MSRKRKPTIHAIPMEAAVSITAGESDGERQGPARFSVVAYTGKPMEVAKYEHPVVVDLGGLQFRNSLVANLDHDTHKRVGHVTEKTVEDGQLRLGGVASAATPARDEVVASAQDGFAWQASIEAMPTKLELLGSGKSEVINGQTVEGPAFIARSSMLRGFAFVSHGADDDTVVAIAAEADDKGKDMDTELREWIEATLPGTDVDDLSDKAIANLEATWKGQEKPKPKPEQFDDIIARERSESKRKDAITATAKQWAANHPDKLELIEAYGHKALEDGWDSQRFRLELFENVALPQSHTVFSSTSLEKRPSETVIEAAICHSLGLTNIEKHYPSHVLEASDRQFRNGIGLKQMYFMCAEANGYRSSYGNGDLLEAQRYAFGLYDRGRPPIQAAAGGFSTISLSSILGNVLRKAISDNFNAIDQSWRSFAAVRPVNDFKQISSYALTGDLDYKFVGPTAEIKHGDLSETTYTNKADTYARMVALTRQDIINDDLGALMAVPRRLGRGGATKLNSVFWTAFLNNSTFFTSGNSNVSTGGGSALGTTGLKAAEVVFMNQTDPDGHPIGIMPSVLLVPPTLKRTAMELMNSSLVVNGGTNTTIPSGNTFMGNYRVVSSPYMENSSYTGYSTAAWYLLSDPMDLATIEVCFLNGRDTPTVETADADFNVLGVQMRGYHDFGVSLQEYRGGVRSAGS